MNSAPTPARRPGKGPFPGSILVLVLPILVVLSILAAGCGNDDENKNGGSPVVPEEDTASISGSVLSAYNPTTARGVAVTVEPYESTSKTPAKAPLAATVTDEQGWFTIAGLAAGQYWLHIDGRSAGPRTTEPYPSQHYASYRLPVQVDDGQALTLDDPVYLHDYDDNLIYPYDGSEAITVMGAYNFQLDLPAGTVTYPDVLTPESVGAQTTYTDRTPVPLPMGLAPTTVTAVVPVGTTFDPGGVVRFFNDFGAEEGDTVDIVGLDPASGQFTTMGTATLQASGWFESEDSFLEQATVLVRACPEHTVVGKVVNQLQTPVAGVAIELVQSRNTFAEPMPIPGMKTTTDADGRFGIPGVRTCLYELRATFVSEGGTATYGVPDITPSDLTPSDNDTIDVGELTLSSVDPVVRFDIGGTARTLDGLPLSGLQVVWELTPTKASPYGPASFADVFTGYSRTREAAEGMAPPSVITGPDGSYHFTGIATEPEVALRVYGASNAYSSAEVDTTAPALADNGSTLQIDLTVCPIPGTCPAGNWSLTNDVLDLSFDTDPCHPPEQVPEITVVALTDGKLSLQITQGTSTQIWQMQRVQGSGPTGISTENLVGLYRTTLDPNDDPGWKYVGLRSDGREVAVQGFDVQSGTYTLDGQRLLLDPTFVDGSHGPLAYDVSVVGNRLVLVSLSGDQVWNLVQCEGAGDGTIDGMWTLEVRDGGPMPVFIFQGSEYAIVLNTNFGIRGS